MIKISRFHATMVAMFTAACLLIGVGYFGMFAPKRPTTTFESAMQAASAASAQAPAPQPIVIQGKPVRLSIPSIELDIAVVDGVYNAQQKTWTLSNSNAHYALISPQPNNSSGNTFIYGHNRKEVFAKLAKVKAGDEALLYTDNGNVFRYVFRISVETNPYDDSLFAYSGPPIVTLQTCSGLWYQNRQLFTFDFVSVTNEKQHAL